MSMLKLSNWNNVALVTLNYFLSSWIFLRVFHYFCYFTYFITYDHVIFLLRMFFTPSVKVVLKGSEGIGFKNDSQVEITSSSCLM